MDSDNVCSPLVTVDPFNINRIYNIYAIKALLATVDYNDIKNNADAITKKAQITLSLSPQMQQIRLSDQQHVPVKLPIQALDGKRKR
jgi:hypothetical protein